MQTTHTRKYLIMTMVLALLLSAFSVTAQDEMAVPEGDVRLGLIAPLTGDAASIGQDQLNWAQLAVDDFNAEMGWNVELVEVDTELSPATATTAVETILTDSSVYGAVGPASSPVTDAVAPQFVEAGMAHISSASTLPDLTLERDYPTFFRVVPTDAAQGPLVADYLYEVLDVRNLFIVDDQTTYAIGLGDQAAARFEELGGMIVDRQSITQEDTDFSALVTRIAGSDSDAVFFPGQLASQGALMATQMLEQGVVIGEDIEFFAADGFFSQAEFIDEAAGATQGAYVSSFPDIRDVEASAELVERYNETFESSLTSFGPPTYIATRTLLDAMAADFEADGELTRAGTLEQVGSIEFEDTILGVPMSFDENGDVTGINFFIYQVEEGEFVVQDTSMLRDEEADMEATEEAMDDMDDDSEDEDIEEEAPEPEATEESDS